MAACGAITPLDMMTSADYGRPITEVMPMGGLRNVDGTGDPGVAGLVAVGDAFCHTDPAFAYGLSFCARARRRRWHGRRLKRTTLPQPRSVTAPMSGPRRARVRLACDMDAARARRWNGEALDPADETAVIRCSR